MNISEPELGWIMGCLFLLGILLAYPALMTALALMRTERVLGKLYCWYIVLALDRRRQ